MNFNVRQSLNQFTFQQKNTLLHKNEIPNSDVSNKDDAKNAPQHSRQSVNWDSLNFLVKADLIQSFKPTNPSPYVDEEKDPIDSKDNDIENAMKAAIENTKDALSESDVSFDDLLDMWLDNNITSKMTKEEREKLIKLATEWMNDYLSKHGNNKSTAALFTKALDEWYTSYKEAQEMIEGLKQASGDDWLNLIFILNDAAENNYVSKQEKKDIIDPLSILVLADILYDDESYLLAQFDKNYKDSDDYKAIVELIAKLKNASSPEEVKQIQDEVLSKIKQYLEKFDADSFLNLKL